MSKKSSWYDKRVRPSDACRQTAIPCPTRADGAPYSPESRPENMPRSIPSPLPFFRQKIAFGSAGELHTTESENPAMAISALPRPLDRVCYRPAAPYALHYARIRPSGASESPSIADCRSPIEAARCIFVSRQPEFSTILCRCSIPQPGLATPEHFPPSTSASLQVTGCKALPYLPEHDFRTKKQTPRECA